jgi:hypothetical protein
MTLMLNMTTFDWLSDLHPLFAAQESWLGGTYNKPVTAQLVYQTSAPFSIACGAGLLVEHIRRFKFAPGIIQRLGQVTDAQGRSVFQESFLNHLQRIRLRAQVNAAPEGTLLLPGSPVLTIQAPELQVKLLDSALRLLIWESSHWATIAAVDQWEKGIFTEEDTPSPGNFPFHQNGWKQRAVYIGGGNPEVVLSDLKSTAEWAGLTQITHSSGHPIRQIRRLFKGENPLGDVWLTDAQEAQASVSHTHIQFTDEKTGQIEEVQMSRFQNLLQPVLVKGHPALSSPGLDYLRQRTWKQLESFHKLSLEGYRRGWFFVCPL